MTPAMPAAAPAAAPVSSPAPAAAAPAITHFQEPTQGANLSVEAEMDAMFAGTPPAGPEGEDIVSEALPADTAPELAAPDAPPAGDEPPAEAAAPETPEPAAEPAAPEPAAAAAGIPEGVKLRMVDGKKAWVVEPKAGEAAFARAALVNEAEEIMGEPMTKEAIEFRQGVVKHWNTMRNEMISDDPADQANFIAGMGNVIRAAAAAGEIGHDALQGIVKLTIDDALRDGNDLSEPILQHITSNPKVLGSIVQMFYERALSEDNTPDPANPDRPTAAQALWNSAQWIDKLFNKNMRPGDEFSYLRKGNYTKLPAYQGEKKVAAATQPKTGTEAAAPAGAPAPTQAFTDWSNKTNQSIEQTAVQVPIDELLKTAVPADQAKKYPTNVQTLRQQLSEKVAERLKSDPSLQEQRKIVVKRARMATSPQIRNQLQQALVNQHATAAKRILREVQGPILTEFAQLLNATSTSAGARAAASANAGRQAPSAGGPSASRTQGTPAKTGTFRNQADFEVEFSQALPTP